MKNLLKRMALFCALCMAAILPSVVLANTNDTMQNIAAGLTIINFIGDLTSSKKTTNQPNQSIVITTIQPALTKANVDPLTVRRVVIDETQIRLTGGYGYLMQSILMSRLRSIMSASGKVLVVIGPSDYKFASELHDAIHDSGRYSPESLAQVERGHWVAPTDYMKLVGTVDINWADQQVSTIFRSSSFSGRRRKVTTIFHLILEPVDLRTGISVGYEAHGQLEKTIDFDVYGNSMNTSGSFSGNQQSIEQEMLYQSATQALISLAAQFQPLPIGQVQQPTIEVSAPCSVVEPIVKNEPKKPTRIFGSISLVLPSGKPTTINTPSTDQVGLNDQIWFFDSANQPIGKFLVLAQDGQTLTLKNIWGVEPQNNNGFGFFYQN